MSMNTVQPMEDRLWDYIDGLCSPSEQSAIGELIAANKEWQDKYRELLNMHQLLNSSELEAPSMRFAKNVMEEIARHHVAPATKTYINKNIIRGIGAFFLTLIASLLVFVLSQFKWSASNSGSGTVSTAIDRIGLEKLNYGKLLNSTYTSLFMLVAVIAGLVLLDAYLQQKKQRAHSNP